MRILRALIVPLITIAIIVLLNNSFGSLPALGKLLDPINGWVANAEPVSKNFDHELALKSVKQPVNVWFEDRLVPHIRASNDYDLYFTQGYIHAYFRLWQMEFQTHAAAGRIGEIVGEKWITDEKTKQRKNAVLEFDRGQRRKGMIYAAENSLKAMEAEPRTKQMLDAYTAGVNTYINSLAYKDYPLEYKLMGYAPEPWTNLKCALLLKTMADDLTGYTEDIPLTVLRDQFPKEEFEYLFPQRLKGSIPVIPEGTKFDPPSLPIPQVPGDSVWSHLGALPTAYSLPLTSEAEGIGSNNWAISGTHTAGGAPILCNDPHLGLNLPSLWFEMQLQTKDLNVYGVSLPGAPGIVIGFNDSISWGFTNNYRDVKDFYEIEEIDKNFYRFDRKPQPYEKRAEVIKVKGKPDFIDTICYTVHGPIMYEPSFPDPVQTGKKLAMQWMAHRGTNELLSLYMLNRAKDYVSFTDAIFHFQCPAQNIIYTDRAGNIAMWGQGQFINKWKDQGRYVMKGNTSATLWGQDIPMTENPHVLNPPQGYLASANQITTDSTYPYRYNGYFYDFRAWRINELLHNNPPKDIAGNMKMQNDCYSFLAKAILPVLLGNLDARTLNKNESAYFIQLKNWDYNLSSEDSTSVLFQIWWDRICSEFDYQNSNLKDVVAKSERIFHQIERKNSYKVNNYAPYWENLSSDLAHLFKASIDSLKKIEKILGSLEWYKVKGTQLTHLAKLDAFSYKNLKIGGWGNTINAVKKTHGPSWRMIVEMGKDSIIAFGVYPGGQSGNPGSKYYGTFVENWVEGKYYELAFLPNQNKQNDKRIKHTWNIRPQ